MGQGGIALLYRHILAAYDGSPQAKKALEQAVRLTEAGGGTKLTVIHAVNLMPVMTGDMLLALPPSMARSVLERAESVVREAEDMAAGLVRIKIETVVGLPAGVILEEADRRGCDLIVVGRRGIGASGAIGAIGEWVLGSVSKQVVQRAKVPVLVVK